MNSFTSPRAKVVVAVLAAIGAIAGLHFLLFRQSAREFQETKAQYDQVRQELEQIGSPKPWQEIHRFRYQTINQELEFWRMLQRADLASDELFTVVTSTPEEVAAEKEKQVQLLWDYLHELEKLRDQQGTKLTFLNSDQQWMQDQSWAILPELPQEVRSSGVALSDRMRELIDTDALMDNIPSDSTLWQQQNQKYLRLLYNVGFNILHRDGMPERGFKGIDENLGETVAVLYTLNRIDLIKRNIPRSEFGFQSELDYNRRLYDLFRLNLEEIDTYNGYRQISALNDIIRLARTHNLREIQRVKLWSAVELRWPPPELEEKPEAAAGGEMNAFAEMFDPAMMGFDPSMGMDPGMMEMMGMDPTLMAGMTGGTQAAAPEEPKDTFGGAVPLELTVIGSNSNVMAFLYDLSHNSKTYEIDAIDIAALPREENVIAAKIVVKVMSYYNAFTPTAADIEKNILTLLQKKKEIATKPGGKELAEEEGFLAEMDRIPSPSPEEAAPAQPPADPAVDPALMNM